MVVDQEEYDIRFAAVRERLISHLYKAERYAEICPPIVLAHLHRQDAAVTNPVELTLAGLLTVGGKEHTFAIGSESQIAGP